MPFQWKGKSGLLRRSRFANCHLPSARQFSQELERLIGIVRRETDAVIAEININFVAFSLNAVNGGSEESMFFVAQQGTHRVFPGICKLIQKFDSGFRGFSGDFDFALIVRSDGDGGFVLVLGNSDHLIEVDCK